MDPFSAAVNVLAVLNTASRASFLLYKVFCGIRDAPTEVKRYANLLEGLSRTFSALHAIHSEDSVGLALSELSGNYSSRLLDCSADLQAVHAKLQRSSLRMKDSPIRKGWERVRWPISSESWIEKFFARVQMYHIQFSLELSCAQLKLQVSLQKLLSCKGNLLIASAFEEDLQEKAKSILDGIATAIPDVIQRLSHNRSDSNGGLLPAEDTSTPLINKPTRNKSDASSNCVQALPLPYGSRKSSYSSMREKTYYYRRSTYSIILKTRSIYHKVWAPWNSTPVQIQPSPFGHSCSIEIKLSFLSFRQLNLKLSILHNSGGTPSLSTRFNLAYPRIVPWNAPIVDLARHGDIFSMESLFRTGQAAPSDMLADGMTLLHIATSRDDVDMIKFLISRGASVDVADKDGDTPLHVATTHGKNYEISRTLIESGCELEALNVAGGTPLHQHFNQVTRHILLVYDGPLDLYTRDHDGMTIVHYLSWSKTTRPEDLARLIKGDSHCLAVKDDLGRSALHFAVMRGNISLITYILSLGIYSNPNLTSQGATLLHYAAYSRRTETLGLVACYCKDIFVRDHQGRSILHYAAWQDNAAAVQKVIELGGMELLYQPSLNGETPLHLATRICATSVLAYADSLGSAKRLPEVLGPAAQGKIDGKETRAASLGSFQILKRMTAIYRIGNGFVVIFILAIAIFLRFPKTLPIS